MAQSLSFGIYDYKVVLTAVLYKKDVPPYQKIRIKGLRQSKILISCNQRTFQFTSHFHVTVPQLDKKSKLQNWSKQILHNCAQ